MFTDRFRRIAFPLFAIDILLILISTLFGVANVLDWTAAWPDLLNIGRDWSLGEIFNYLKWLALGVLLFAAYQREGEFLLLAMAGTALVLLSDDALQIHETGGKMIAYRFNFHDLFQKMATQTGALMVWAFLGLIILIVLIIGWRKASDELKAKVIPMGWLFAGIVFCAAFIDSLHALTPDYSVIAGMFMILEDGGEMLFITAWVSYAAAVFGGSPIAAK